MDIESARQFGQKVIKPKSSTKQLEFHVASVYEEIAKMIDERDDLQIEMPRQVPTASQRVNLIKSVIGYLLDEAKTSVQPNTKANANNCEDNLQPIACSDCVNYEKNLQKLEGEIRNHIRTHQQLRLYQDGLEEKIEEMKKQNKEHERKFEGLKKKYEELRNVSNSTTDKLAKLENENERLRTETKNFMKAEDLKRLNRYESNKQNLCEWRNKIKLERNSIEKRPDSTERMRVSVNVRSNKGIPISSKIVQEKAKEEKARAIKNRLGFGY